MADQGLNIGVRLGEMGKSVVEKALIAVVEPMIQPGGGFVLARRKRKQSTIFLKLIHDELVQCEVSRTDERVTDSRRVDGQNTLQPKGASGSRKRRWWPASCEVGNARNHGVARVVGQRSYDRRLRGGRSKDVAPGQQRHRVLCI